MTSPRVLTTGVARTTRPLSSGTVDLMGAFRTLERTTGAFFEHTPMVAERRDELIEELVAWSTGEGDGFDWHVLDQIDPPTPADFTA